MNEKQPITLLLTESAINEILKGDQLSYVFKTGEGKEAEIYVRLETPEDIARQTPEDQVEALDMDYVKGQYKDYGGQ